jgi:hypothetical protein
LERLPPVGHYDWGVPVVRRMGGVVRLRAFVEATVTRPERQRIVRQVLRRLLRDIDPVWKLGRAVQGERIKRVVEERLSETYRQK